MGPSEEDVEVLSVTGKVRVFFRDGTTQVFEKVQGLDCRNNLLALQLEENKGLIFVLDVVHGWEIEQYPADEEESA
jgi:hypothetical protein